MKKVILASGATALWLALGGVAFAQAPDTTPKNSPAAVVSAPELNKKIASMPADKVPLRDIATTFSKITGIRIIVDPSLAATPITLDGKSETLADAMKQVAAQLQKGATVRYVALPIDGPLPGVELVTQAVVAQDGLKPLRIAGADPDPSAAVKPKKLTAPPVNGIVAPASATEPTIELAGRDVTLDKAAPVIGSLNLTPVYVVMNPLGDNLVAKSGRLQAESLQTWLGMTPEQRKQAAESQFNNLLSMDPSTRRALFGQMMEQGQAMSQKLMSLPADQRAAFFSDITGGKFDGRNLPPPGGKPGN